MDKVGFFKHMSLKSDLLNLKVSLESHLPAAGQILNVVNLKIHGRFTEATQVDFYVYQNRTREGENQDHDHDLTDPFVLCVQEPNIHTLYNILIWAPNNPSLDMIQAFESFVQWDKIQLFPTVNQEFFTKYLQPLCKKYGGLVKYPNGFPCESYALSRDVALGLKIEDLLQCPENGGILKIQPLSGEDATEMVRNWGEWARPHSKGQVELAIRNLTSCGVYIEGVLASSALLSPVGLINILYTDEGYRKRGLGVKVMKALGKSIAEMELIPMAECEVWNEASRGLLMKSGFTFLGLTNWVKF